MIRRAIVAIGLGAVGILGGGLGACSLLADRDTRSVAEKYTACVARAGLDVGGAQPVYDEAGAITWMKTGVDVPVTVHSGCFKSVGGTGASLRTSSWGR